MKINSVREIDSVCFQIREADFTRSRDRARIDRLLDGWPPYSSEEVEKNRVAVNVNFLEGTRIAHDARSQFNSAFTKPAQYFTLRTDMGPQSKRANNGAIVTHEMNRIMKRSMHYYECFRGKFALNVAHGIGPGAWPDQDHWCPEEQGITDIGIPARTRLHMKNLPFFYVYRAFTQPELIRLTKRPNVDPGWNIPMVDAALEWLATETLEMIGQNWSDYWSAEKVEQAVKSDGGFFVGDQVPTINCFDFYYFDDCDSDAGWRRRIILDSWSTPEAAGGSWKDVTRKGDEPFAHPDKYGDGESKGFLYTSFDKKFADKRENIVGFTFADLSAVAPFEYHSVRSLGYLLYAVCHLQNRLRCSFTEAVFENLLQMFRIKSADDIQRALKLKLYGFAFVDDNLTPMPANERFQPNQGLIQLGLAENARLIQEHSSSWTQQANMASDRVEKTKFQVMAEVNAMTSLVSAALGQAYQYQNGEYYEIVRRFMKENSCDPDVQLFRGNVMKRGVSAKLLVPEYWDCEPEQVMGAGNKTLEMAISQQLMEWRALYDPSSQRDILRKATLAITGDAKWSDALVPDQPKTSDSVHDTELAFGTLMQGVPVTAKDGLNAVEVAGTMIKLMGQKVQGILKSRSIGTPQDLQGLGLASKYCGEFIKQLAEDDNSKPIAKKLGQTLGKIVNELKGLAQRQQQAAQAQAQKQNGGLDPKDAAKIQATALTAAQKVKQMKESHAAKTAQRKIQFQEKMNQDQQRATFELQKDAAHAGLDLQSKRLKNL